jgi:hypothetical protein
MFTTQCLSKIRTKEICDQHGECVAISPAAGTQPGVEGKDFTKCTVRLMSNLLHLLEKLKSKARLEVSPILICHAIYRKHKKESLRITDSKKTGQKMKMAVFWVVAPCGLVEVYRSFRGPCFLHHQLKHR